MKEKKDYTLGTLEKAFNILDVFTFQTPELSLNEIKNIVGMPKPTVFRLLFTMEKYGFIRKVNSTGNYRLGLKLLYLGNLVSKSYDIVRIAQPFMSELCKDIGETVELTIINNDQALLIETVESEHYLKAYSPVGKKLPLHCTASGKVLAAYSADKISVNWPPEVLTAYTPKTIIDQNILQDELELVRKLGYATDEGELDESIQSFSTPIFDSTSGVPAALTVVVPISRLSKKREKEILEKLKKYAADISNELNNYCE